GLPALRQWYPPAAGAERTDAPPTSGRVTLVKGQKDTLEVQPDVVEKLKLLAKEAGPPRPRPLELPGSLALDPQTLARIHARFPGEVIEIEQVRDEFESDKKGQSVLRPLRPGDRVRKGDRLAILWSKDLGEKKSELVDALTTLKLHEDLLKRYEQAN